MGNEDQDEKEKDLKKLEEIISEVLKNNEKN